MKGSPAKLGTIEGTAGHRSALKHSKGGKQHKHLFERITGKKFKETKVGKFATGTKEKVVKGVTEKRIKKDVKKGGKGKGIVPGTRKTLAMRKETYRGDLTKKGSVGELKPVGKDTPIDVKRSKGYEFTRGGGDPYLYKTEDKGKTYMYKKSGETGWSVAKGGIDKIKHSYTESKKKPLTNIKKDKEIKERKSTKKNK